mmetsp:Transcript_18477/g.51039  ORF Transcript_18477/g.51039 Transcript_18477/m.51039 type:complete len:135 (+) Transcript_18477:187-591(+)
MHQLSPDVVKDPWTREEDLAIIVGQASIGNKWTELADALPGRWIVLVWCWSICIIFPLTRTGNAVKNRWHWMISQKKEHYLDTVVLENAHVFRQILNVSNPDPPLHCLCSQANTSLHGQNVAGRARARPLCGIC